MLHYDICRIDPWKSHKSSPIKLGFFFSNTLASLILIPQLKVKVK